MTQIPTLYLEKLGHQLPKAYFGKMNHESMSTLKNISIATGSTKNPGSTESTLRVQSNAMTLVPTPFLRSQILTNLSSFFSLAARKLYDESKPISTVEDFMAFALWLLCFIIILSDLFYYAFSLILFSILIFFLPCYYH